jgi:hypothetical protein
MTDIEQERRARYAEAVAAVDSNHLPRRYLSIVADAVLAVADAELADLKAEIARLRARIDEADTETEAASEDAAKAEATIGRVKALCDNWMGGTGHKDRGSVMTLTDFLLARIAEDEAVARGAIADDGGSNEGFANQYDRMVGTYDRPLDWVPRIGEDAARLIARFAVPARVLAECEAKRRIVELISSPGPQALRLLALPYADHPDYLPEWRP